MDIKEVLEYLEKDAISIYQYGSVVLPYIKHKKDNDKFYFYTPEIAAEKYAFLKPHIRELREQDFDLHIKDMSTFNPLEIWAYQHRYCKLSSGEHLDFESIDVLDCAQRYKDALYAYADARKDHPKIVFLKAWYHVYTGLCILNNNSYDLTQEQIENINMLHDLDRDEDIIKKRIGLIKWCLNELNIDLPEFTE